MGFKYFQGLLQFAVALSFAEWMTKPNANQDFVPNGYLLPQDLLNRQIRPHLPTVPHPSISAFGHSRLLAQKDQGLLEQLLSLDSACERGDIVNRYERYLACPVEGQINTNVPLSTSSDDIGYNSGSESLASRCSSSPFTGSESACSPTSQVPETQSRQFGFLPPNNDFESCGAACLPTPDDFDNINIVDLISGTDYDDTLNFSHAGSPVDKQVNNFLSPSGRDITQASHSLRDEIGHNNELFQLLNGNGKSPSIDNVNFYTPTFENSNAEDDPFLIDFGLSGSSSSEEDFPDDLMEALNTFDKYYKGSPEVFNSAKFDFSDTKFGGSAGINSHDRGTSSIPSLQQALSEQTMTEAEGKHTPFEPKVPKGFDSLQEEKKDDWLSLVDSPVFDPLCDSVDSVLETNSTGKKGDFLSGIEKTKTIINIGEDLSFYKGKGARPKVNKFPGLPFSEEDLINMPVDKFNSVIESLDHDKASRAKDLRRKGKNKIAARNCRKRKLEAIQDLDHEISQVDRDRNALLEEQEELEKDLKEILKKTDLMYDYIFDSLRDENGLPYSREHFSLQYTSDGSVYLVPNSSKLKSTSTIAKRRDNQVH